MTQHRLTTGRLLLRPFTMDDAPDVQRYASAYEVAFNTLQIAHPYPEGAAEEWIGRKMREAEDGGETVFAITRRSDGAFVGTIGLIINRQHDMGELGYWIALPFWGEGYATEAAGAVIQYAFEERDLNRVFAAHFSRNPGSGRVMEKNGMRHEGKLRQSAKKWDEYLDVEMYSILREERPIVVEETQEGE